MKINVKKLIKGLKLGQQVTKGDLKIDTSGIMGVVPFYIKNGEVVLMATGGNIGTTVKALYHLGTIENQSDGCYAVQTTQLLKVLSEVDDEEVELEFHEDTTYKYIKCKSSIGSAKFGAMQVDTPKMMTDGNPDFEYEQLTKIKTAVSSKGTPVDHKELAKAFIPLKCAVAKATRPIWSISEGYSELNTLMASVRYKVDLPFTCSFNIPVAQVFNYINTAEGTETAKVVTTVKALSYVSGDVTLVIIHPPVKASLDNYGDMPFELSEDVNGNLDKAQLMRMLKITEIFIKDSSEDICMEFDYKNNLVRLSNQGAESSSANLSLPYTTENQDEETVSIGIMGDFLLKVLGISSGKEVGIELMENVRKMHISFDEGDAHLNYLAKSL